jgi:hypothetical protein
MQEYNSLIKGYLENRLSVVERKAFEEESKNSPALKQAIIRYAIEGENLPTKADMILDRIRSNNQPFSAPTLTWTESWRYFFYDKKWLFYGGVSGLALIAILIIYILLSLATKHDLIEKQCITPICVDNAGVVKLDQEEILRVASRNYCIKTAKSLDSLNWAVQVQFDHFNVAYLYLGHYHLREGNYQLAEKIFERCYQNRLVMAEFGLTEDILALEYNLILAKYGAGVNSYELVPKLELLIKEFPPSASDLEKVNQFTLALKHPLNRFRRL